MSHDLSPSPKSLMKKTLNLIVTATIIFIIILLTTFGWQPSSKYEPILSNSEKDSLQNIQKIVNHLSHTIGVRNYTSHKNLQRAASFIIEYFQQLGYSVKINSYNFDGKTYKNIVAEYSKDTTQNDTIIIGAHYDSCFNPGADDNASGIAGVIELARLLKETPLKHNIKFIAFTNEEPPFFQTNKMGSRVYTKEIQSSGENITAAIILEMLGYYSEKPFSQRYLPLLGPFYPNKADFIAIVGNFESKDLVKNLYHGFDEKSKFPVEKIVSPGFIPGINFSDHWSFWKVGIPAVMITDTAYLRNNNYHKGTDLPETLNYEKMVKVIFGLRDAIIELDQNPILRYPTF